jgi:hypothetical protein
MKRGRAVLKRMASWAASFQAGAYQIQGPVVLKKIFFLNRI